MLLFLFSFVHARESRAECGGNASSCVQCHESRGQRPVLTSPAPWHRDHGFGDLCAACHAGDPESLLAQEAHLGLRDPLAEVSTCQECHDDAARRIAGYLDVRATTTPPASIPPSTPPSEGEGGPRAPVVDHALGLVAAMLFVALVLVLRHRVWPRPPTLRDALRASVWAPSLAGIGLGLTVTVSMVYCGRILAVSGAFDKLAAFVGAAVFPSHPYWRHVMLPGINWQVWLVVGLCGGAFVSAWSAGTFRVRWLPDSLWRERFGSRTATRLALAFVGAFLVQFGAGIAGGCTSGMAISGGAVMSPAAFVFMAAMFAAGIPTAWVVGRLAVPTRDRPTEDGR